MFLGEKTHLDNLKSNTTHWQINKYWPKALLVTSVQHERLLRFHTAKSSGQCPENDLHWLVIFSPLSFSSLLLLLWLPSVQVSNKLRQWELRWRERPQQSGTVWDDRNIHQSICDLTKGDADRRWDVYNAVMSFTGRNTSSMMKPLQTQISVAPATFLYSSSSSSSCHPEPWAQTLKQHTTPLYQNDLVVRWQPPTQIVAQTNQPECLFVLQGPCLRL